MRTFSRAIEGITPRFRTGYSVDPQLGIGDPALAEYLGIGASSASGVLLTESTALELSAVWRAVALTSGTIAGLPIKTYKREGERKERVSGLMDNPHPDMTQFEWTETVLAHLLLWGNAYLLHIYGGAGQILGLAPIHPSAVIPRWEDDGKVYTVRQRKGGTREYTALDLTQIPGLSYDGLAGMSPIGRARNSLGTALAGERAAGRIFKNGLMLGGVMSPKEAVFKTQAKKLLDGLKAKAGFDNAGDIAWMPAAVDFKPWTMNPIDAQFLESRHFGIEECGRWFGTPRELLNESGASSWGSGIHELVKGWQRFTLSGWTSRIEQRITKLTSRNTFVEYDYSGLLQPSPEVEIDLLVRQVEAGILTINEARAIRNLPPVAWGNDRPGAPVTPALITGERP